MTLAHGFIRVELVLAVFALFKRPASYHATVFIGRLYPLLSVVFYVAVDMLSA